MIRRKVLVTHVQKLVQVNAAVGVPVSYWSVYDRIDRVAMSISRQALLVEPSPGPPLGRSFLAAELLRAIIVCINICA